MQAEGVQVRRVHHATAVEASRVRFCPLIDSKILALARGSYIDLREFVKLRRPSLLKICDQNERKLRLRLLINGID